MSQPVSPVCGSSSRRSSSSATWASLRYPARRFSSVGCVQDLEVHCTRMYQVSNCCFSMSSVSRALSRAGRHSHSALTVRFRASRSPGLSAASASSPSSHAAAADSRASDWSSARPEVSSRFAPRSRCRSSRSDTGTGPPARCGAHRRARGPGSFTRTSFESATKPAGSMMRTAAAAQSEPQPWWEAGLAACMNEDTPSARSPPVAAWSCASSRGTALE